VVRLLESIQVIREKQIAILEILRDIDRICRNNNIKYSLGYGTLIGAIRHKGFIPWDDDADLLMERSEFEKFSIAYNKEKGTNYQFKTILWVPRIFEVRSERNPGIHRENPTVDIFILDRLPRSRLKRKMKILVIKFLQGMLKRKVDYSKYNWRGKILTSVTKSIGRIFSEDWKLQKYQVVSKWGNREDSDSISVTNTLYSSLRQFFSVSCVSDYTNAPFEGVELMIMKGYDEFLRTVYGDYMTPPPQEQRVPKHFDI